MTAAEPPLKLLTQLEDWLNRTRARLNQEKELVCEAKNAAQFAEILQKLQVHGATLLLLSISKTVGGPEFMTGNTQRSEIT